MMKDANGEILQAILEELEDMGVNEDTPINGADAVEYLQQLRTSLEKFLKIK